MFNNEKILGNLSFIVCFFKSRLTVILGLMEKYLSAAELAWISPWVHSLKNHQSWNGFI